MEYATLGNTGLLASRLCFVALTFGDGTGLFKAISTVDQGGTDEKESHLTFDSHGGFNAF